MPIAYSSGASADYGKLQANLAQLNIEKEDSNFGALDLASRYSRAIGNGLYQGATVRAPEQLYRTIRTLSKITGSDAMKVFATNKLDDLKAEIEANPEDYDYSEFMQDRVSRSLFEGTASIAQNFGTMAAAAGAGAVSGGTGAVAVLALGSGLMGGLSEYDNFLDQAYEEMRVRNPNLSWDDVADAINVDEAGNTHDVGSNAIYSAVAEGGVEALSNLIAGRLAKLAAKPIGEIGGKLGVQVAAKSGKEGVEVYRSLANKLVRGALIAGPLSNVPEEMATSAIQDWARKNAGLDHVGMTQAALDAIGPSLVASFGMGAAHAGIEAATAKGKTPAVGGGVREALDALAAKAMQEHQETVSSGEVAPEVPAGYVRFYHGGIPGEGGTRWVSPDLAYAQGYAAKSEDGQVLYTDIPENDPRLMKAFDDEGTSVKAPYVAFEVDNSELKPYVSESPKDLNVPGQPLGSPRKPIAPEHRGPEAVIKRLSRAFAMDGQMEFGDVAAIEEVLSQLPQEVSSDLAVSVRKRKEGDPVGRYWNTMGLIEMFVGGSSLRPDEVFSHEAGHKLEDVVPAEHLEEVHAEYLREKNKFGAANPWMDDLLEGTQTEQTKALTEEQKLQAYRFRDSSEYFAERVRDIFTGKKEYADGVWGKVQKVIDYIKTSLTKALGRDKVQSIIDGVASGKIKLQKNPTDSMVEFRDMQGEAPISSRWDNATIDSVIDSFTESIKDGSFVNASNKPSKDGGEIEGLNLNPILAAKDFNVEHLINAIAQRLDFRLKDKKDHKVSRIIAHLGVDGFDPEILQTVHKLGKDVENGDSVVIAAAMTEKAMATIIPKLYQEGRVEEFQNATRYLIALLSANKDVASGTGRMLAAHGVWEKDKKFTFGMTAKKLLQVWDKSGNKQPQLLINHIADMALADEKIDVAEALKALSEGKLPDDVKIERAMAVIGADDVSKAVKSFAKETRLGIAGNMLSEWMISNMLTGPKGRIRDVLSMGALVADKVLNRSLARFTIDSQYGVQSGESTAMMQGFFGGFLDAIRGAYVAARTGKVASNPDAFKTDAAKEYVASGAGKALAEQADVNATDSESAVSGSNGLKLFGMRSLNLTPGQQEAGGPLTGMAKIIHGAFEAAAWVSPRLVRRTMLGLDEFASIMAYSTQRAAVMHRVETLAKKLDVSPEQALEKLIGKGQLHEMSKDFARDITLKSELGDFQKKLLAARDGAVFGGIPVGKMVVPFMKTAMNIINYAGVRTPGISNLFDQFKREMNSGDPARIAEAEARILTGTVFWYGALTLASSGLITGSGPDDKEEREVKMQSGWRPNSVKIGDTWVGLSNLDPAATFLTTAGNVIDAADSLEDEDLSKAMWALFGASLKVTLDKSSLAGVANIYNAVTGRSAPDGSTSNLLAPLMPMSGLLGSITKSVDPVIRESDDIVSGFMKKFPLTSSLNRPKRGLFGEELKYDSDSVLQNTFNPLNMGKASGDPMYQELDRLNSAVGDRKDMGYKFNITKHRANLVVGKKAIPLNSEQYDRLLTIDGVALKDSLAKLFSSVSYTRMNDEQRGAAVMNLMHKVRTRSKAAFLSEYIKRK